MAKIQHRRGTTSQWSKANPTLAAGEIGLDTDLMKIKMGDGSTAWNSLGFAKVGVADKIRASGVERTIFVGSSTPSGAANGDIWIKTS